ncbi:hypothetical protein QAD02_021021 [Eretmocerus hayati]|uniref:Uncharacterized protein n=1 Tax=Eretmocerus hayati TaxID=131215 RepID=A0ACC2PQD3_9HYME|nr:hypothetical protein QAD02_021021 [Eretmocerus hayati]
MLCQGGTESMRIEFVEVTVLEKKKNIIVPLCDVFATKDEDSHIRPSHLEDYIKDYHYQVKWFGCTANGLRCSEDHFHGYRLLSAVIHRLGEETLAVKYSPDYPLIIFGDELELFVSVSGTCGDILDRSGTGPRQKFKPSTFSHDVPRTRANQTKNVKKELLDIKKSQKKAMLKRSQQALDDAINTVPLKIPRYFHDSDSSDHDSSSQEQSPKRSSSSVSDDMADRSTVNSPYSVKVAVAMKPCSVQLIPLMARHEASALDASISTADLPTGANQSRTTASHQYNHLHLANTVNGTVSSRIGASGGISLDHLTVNRTGARLDPLSQREAMEAAQLPEQIESVQEVDQPVGQEEDDEEHRPIPEPQEEAYGLQESPRDRVYQAQIEQARAQQAQAERLREVKIAQARAREEEAERLREVRIAQARAQQGEAEQRARAEREEAERLREAQIQARAQQEQAAREAQMQQARAQQEEAEQRARAQQEEAERLREAQIQARAQQEQAAREAQMQQARAQQEQQERARQELDDRIHELERLLDEARGVAAQGLIGVHNQGIRQDDAGGRDDRPRRDAEAQDQLGIVAAAQNREAIDGYGRPQRINRRGRPVREARSRRQLAVSVYDTYHQPGGPHSADRLTYRYRVVGTRIHLSQNFSVDIVRWGLINRSTPRTFIISTTPILFTHEELLVSALDPTQIRNTVPGYPRPRTINREKLLLLMSLYHDYVFGEHSITTIKEREGTLLKGCDYLSRFLWEYRDTEIRRLEAEMEGQNLDEQ